MSIKVRPLRDRVIVKRVEDEQVTAAGIVIPDTAKEKPVKGQVVAVGSGKLLDSGEVLPVDVEVGNTVLFGKYAGTEVKVGDEELLVLREEDIMGVVEGK